MEINKINWEPMYSYNDIDAAYKFFDESITACYNSSSPVIRLSRKRAKDKKWITAGLKTCSKRKNFYIKSGFKPDLQKMRPIIRLIGDSTKR